MTVIPSMFNETNTCYRNELNNILSNTRLNVYELEHGSVIHPSNNEATFWTIFTLICSSVGILLSAAALALLILTALMFTEWRRVYKNQLLIQFMFARFFYSSFRFFSDIQKVFNICPKSEATFALDLLIMIYSEMVLVVWMFVFTRQMYIGLVKLFVNETSNIWTVSLCAWIGPAVVSLLLHFIFYVGTVTSKYFLLYVILLKWPVLIANAILLILILRSVLINNQKSENNVRIIIVMLVLIFIFCFQQILIDICKIVFVLIVNNANVISKILIIGNILAMYHCAFSIVFWVLGNANTRKLWKFQGRDFRSKIRLSIRFSA